jgi:xylose isomerase
VQQGRLAALVKQRYAGWESDLGRKISAGGYDLAGLARLAIEGNRQPLPPSGKQELFESLIASAAAARE